MSVDAPADGATLLEGVVNADVVANSGSKKVGEAYRKLENFDLVETRRKRSNTDTVPVARVLSKTKR